MTISKEQLSKARVLVVGDAMIDRYWYGAVDRISPEAPVPVVRVTREEERIGGGANGDLYLIIKFAPHARFEVDGENLIINLPLVGLWVKLLRIPYRLFYPIILVCMCIGVYTTSNSGFDVFLLVIFGFISYLFIKWKCEPAPLLLAFVLEPIIEQNFKRALQMSYGDPMTFVKRPLSLGLLLVGVIFLALMLLPAIRKTREVAFQE
jgi:hypothetical protein